MKQAKSNKKIASAKLNVDFQADKNLGKFLIKRGLPSLAKIITYYGEEQCKKSKSR